MATNPAVSMPESNRIKTAIQNCEFVVVSDCVSSTETTDLAHIKLPALTWGEKDGTVTNSDRTISRQRAFLPKPGLAKPDWWIICEVARLMGWEEPFDFQNAADVFREHARLSAFENNGERLFNLEALANITDRQYDRMIPVQWPVTHYNQQGTDRLFQNAQFPTVNKRANLVPVKPQMPTQQPDHLYPYILNTGRVRDHWHTMTRTGISSRLSAHIPEPFVEIHPIDADTLELQNGQLAKITTESDHAIARVKICHSQQQGSAFMPMHWNQQYSARAKPTALVRSVSDPISGQPESKHAVVNICPFTTSWHGFILTRKDCLEVEFASYWTRTKGLNMWRLELAGLEQPKDWIQYSKKLLCPSDFQDFDWIEFQDLSKQHFRIAQLVNGKLESCLFIGPDENLPGRDWLTRLFDKQTLSQTERLSLLSGYPPADQEDTGKTVCSCFNVGEKSIEKAIATGCINSIEELGAQLKAGTNCGSCIPELKAFLNA